MDVAGNSTRLHQLTSLRFFAACAVLVFHLDFLRKADAPWSTLARTIFAEGYGGVSFFFILSGFILSHTYQQGLLRGAVPASRYVLLRMARIFPLHWIMAAILILCHYNNSGRSLETVLNLLLLQAWVPARSYYFSLNAVSWTLSVELFFYCLFVYLARVSSRRIAAGCVVWAAVICLGAALYLTAHRHWLSYRFITWFFLANPVTRLLEFLVGMLTYRIATDCACTRRLRSEGLCVVLLLVAAGIYSVHKIPSILRYQIIYLPIMAYVIFSFAAGEGRLSGFLRRRALVLLGEASFSLYMIHQPLIEVSYGIYRARGYTFSPALLALALLALSIGLSLVVYQFVERPLHRFLKRKIATLIPCEGRPPSAGGAAASAGTCIP